MHGECSRTLVSLMTSDVVVGVGGQSPPQNFGPSYCAQIFVQKSKEQINPHLKKFEKN